MAAPTSDAKHFVLVHGGAHGAWCWYKIVDLLQQAGHKVSALDLASAGINNADPGKVETLQQLATPLLSFLQALPDSEKVILVVHSMGGLSGTLAMELFPGKITAAIFVAALMFPDPKHENAGAIVQVFESLFATLMAGKVRLLFGNGAEKPPTAMEVGQDHVVDLFYHLSPSLDVALAKLCLKPFPAWSDMGRELLVPITPERYGSVPRVYLDCKNDRAVSGDLADIMCRSLPPKERILLQADHSPFFSAPADLTAHLLRIAHQT